MAEDMVLQPEGHLDRFVADGVLEDWVRLVDRGAPGRVTVDLSSVSYLDLAGVKVLVMLHQRLGDRGVPVHLRGARADHRGVLRICGVEQLFPDSDMPADEVRTQGSGRSGA